MYEHKIAEYEVSLEKARNNLAEILANNGDPNSAYSLVERLEHSMLKAKDCQAVIKRIKTEADGRDPEPIVKRMILNNEIGSREVAAVLMLAPIWSKSLCGFGTAPFSKPASLYQIEFIRKSDNAVFYKVGHTKRQISERLTGFKFDRKAYKASLNHQVLFARPHLAAAEEARLHAANTALKYDGEPFLSNGHTEVYTEPLISYTYRLELCLYALLGIERV